MELDYLTIEQIKAATLLGEGQPRLAGITDKLRGLNEWNAQSVEAVVREHAEAIGAKLGQVAQPLRAAAAASAGCTSDALTALGAPYHPSLGITPERVQPFVVPASACRRHSARRSASFRSPAFSIRLHRSATDTC